MYLTNLKKKTTLYYSYDKNSQNDKYALILLQ